MLVYQKLCKSAKGLLGAAHELYINTIKDAETLPLLWQKQAQGTLVLAGCMTHEWHSPSSAFLGLSKIDHDHCDQKSLATGSYSAAAPRVFSAENMKVNLSHFTPTPKSLHLLSGGQKRVPILSKEL